MAIPLLSTTRGRQKRTTKINSFNNDRVKMSSKLRRFTVIDSTFRRSTTSMPSANRTITTKKSAKRLRPTTTTLKKLTVMPQIPVCKDGCSNSNFKPNNNKSAAILLSSAGAIFTLTPTVISRNFSLLAFNTNSTVMTDKFDNHEDLDYLTDHDEMSAIHHTSNWHEYLFPFLVLFPVITIFGNALVVLLCSIMVTQAVRGRGSRGESITTGSAVRKLSWSSARHSITNGRTATSTATNFYLISLSSADLIIGAFVMPFALYLEWTDGRWSLGTFACDLWITIDNLATTASILSLAAIAQNRYLAIARPVTYSNLQRKRRLIFIGIPIGIVWAISTAVAAPIVLGLNDVADRKPRFCKLYRVEYLLYTSVVSFFIPSIAIGLQYVAVFRALGARARRMMLRRVSVVMSRIRQGSTAGSMNSNDTPNITARTSAVDQTQFQPTVRFDMRGSNNNCRVINSTPPQLVMSTIFDESLTCNENSQISQVDIEADYSEPLKNTPSLINKMTGKQNFETLKLPPRSCYQISPHFENSLRKRRQSEPFFRQQTFSLIRKGNQNENQNKDQNQTKESDDEEDEDDDWSPKLRSRLTSFSSLTSLTSFQRTSSNAGQIGFVLAPPSSKRQSASNEENVRKSLVLNNDSTKESTLITRQNEETPVEKDSVGEAVNSSEAVLMSRLNYSASVILSPQRETRKFSEAVNSNSVNSTKSLRKKRHRAGKLRRNDSKVTRERRATVMLSVVLVLFYACWLPYFLATVSKSVCAHFDSRSHVEQVEHAQCVPDVVMHVLAWLGHANSMANPFVYAIFNPDFRAAFWRIFGDRIVFRLNSLRSASSSVKSS